MKDLTVIMLTLNKLPQKWVDFHKKKLLEVAYDFPLITVSAKPMPDMPGLNIIQEPPFNASNIYRQMLKAAKIAETPFVAIVEDDSVYSREHFIKFRPKPDEFAYNMSRWALFTWVTNGEYTYFWRDRLSNLTLIAPRELLIKCLEERFEKYPEGTPENRTGEVGKDRIERMLRLPHYKHVKFWTTEPVVNLNHTQSLDPRENDMTKRRSFVRAYDIPVWRKAEDLLKNFL